MRCSTYQEKISDYIDNALPALERQQIESHLSTCPPCHSLYQDLRMICETSQNLPECEPSQVVWERILAEISPRQAGMVAPGGSGWVARWFPFKSPKPSAWVWQPALAAALLLLAIAAFMRYRSSIPPPEPVAGGRGGWTNTLQHIEVQPANILIVHKPFIDVNMVQQRIDKLQKRIQTVQSRWSPEVQALYQHHLQMVDYCINNCQSQLAVQEDDPAARAVYQAALRAKLELLKRFSDM